MNTIRMLKNFILNIFSHKLNKKFKKFKPFIFRPQTIMTRLNFDKPQIIGTPEFRECLFTGINPGE